MLIFATLRDLWTIIGARNLGLISAGIGFFAFLSLFPALAAMIAIWGVVADPASLQLQLGELRALVPQEIYAIIDRQLTTLVSAGSGTLGWAGALSLMLALWSARAGTSALLLGLNAIEDVPNRGGIWHYLTALLLTLMLITVTLVTLGSVVVAPILLAVFPIGGATELIIDGLRWLLAVLAVLSSLGLLYRYGPNRRCTRPLWKSPGAAVTLVLWIAASSGFSIYLSRFSNYNEVYGSIGAVVALLMWFYISAFLILLGAALNRVLDLRAG